MEELVFAVPTGILRELLTYKDTGFTKGNGDMLKRMVRHGLFRKRNELEEDPSFKQIIPYGIISHKGSFLSFKRTSGQREKRLHNKLHLGVGGHMNPRNPTEPDEQYLVEELKRELFEEVNLSNDCIIEKIEFIGFINDDSIPVGKVHIGLLFTIQVSGKDIVVNETDKMTASWTDKSGLADLYEELETWSKIAFDHFIR